MQSISYSLTLNESKVVTVSTCGSALDTRLDIARVIPDPEPGVATNDDHVRPSTPPPPVPPSRPHRRCLLYVPGVKKSRVEWGVDIRTLAEGSTAGVFHENHCIHVNMSSIAL